MKIPMRLSGFVGFLSLRMQKHYVGAMFEANGMISFPYPFWGRRVSSELENA